MGTLSVAHQTDDESILLEFRSGDINIATTKFVRKHQRFVYSLCLRQLHNSYDAADDAAQEVFIRAVSSIASFKQESSVSTWLYRITMNVCSTHRRKANLYRGTNQSFLANDTDTIDEQPTPHEHVEQNDFRKKLDLLLDELPEKQRQTFIMKYFDELTYEEISSILGTSVGALKANYFHAVQKLSKRIQETALIDLREFGYE